MDFIKNNLKWWLLLASILGVFFTISYLAEIMEGDDSIIKIIIMCIWGVMTIVWSGMCIREFKRDNRAEEE